jgi:hypothetical protein
MTDFIEQELLVCAPIFSGGTSVANGEHTLAAIADIDLPDEAAFDDGGDLARSPDILSSLAVDLERAGLAGEKRTSQIIYRAATSRLFSQPLSVAVKGPSSGGKSYTVQSALRFLPQEACFTLTSASEKALIYTDEDLCHHMLVLYEADAVAKGGLGAYLLRTLLSEGEIRHETVEKAGKGFATKKITKSGPTGLIVTITATGLDAELETRMLSLTVTDTHRNRPGPYSGRLHETTTHQTQWRSIMTAGTDYSAGWPLANEMSLSPLQSNWQIVFLHLPSGSGVISVRC